MTKRYTSGQFCVIGNCNIGDNVTIGHQVIIPDGASIGSDVVIESGSILCPGIIIENGVYIGPGVIFLHDRYPHRTNPEVWEPPVIKAGAIINGGVVVCPGVTIGVGAKVAGGAVVTKSVRSNMFVVGVPARPWDKSAKRGSWRE